MKTVLAWFSVKQMKYFAESDNRSKKTWIKNWLKKITLKKLINVLKSW